MLLLILISNSFTLLWNEDERMSIEELVAKYMKEQDNMTRMFFEGQYENLPSTLGVNTEEEN